MSADPKRQRGRCDAAFWTKTKSIQLIKLFKGNRDLWDASRILYCDRNHKQMLLTKIAENLQTDASEVASKLHNLRCQYNGELRKIKAKRNKSATNGSYVPRWEFFNSLKFLSDAGHQSRTFSNKELLNTLSEDFSEQCTSEPAKNVSQLPDLSKSSLKQKRKTSEKLQKESLINESIRLLGTTVDSHQIFADYIADQLRNMSTEKQKRLKTLIQMALLEVEETPETKDMSLTTSPTNLPHFSEVSSQAVENDIFEKMTGNEVKQETTLYKNDETGDNYVIINDAELDTINNNFNHEIDCDPLVVVPTTTCFGEQATTGLQNVLAKLPPSLSRNRQRSIKRKMSEEIDLNLKRVRMEPETIREVISIETEKGEKNEEDLIDNIKVTTFIFKGEEYVQMLKEHYLQEKSNLLSGLRRFKSIINNAKFRLNVQLKFSSY